MRKDQSIQGYINLAKSKIFRILFRQGYKKKKDLTTILSLSISNNVIDPINFITKVDTEGWKQMTWITKGKEKCSHSYKG